MLTTLRSQGHRQIPSLPQETFTQDSPVKQKRFQAAGPTRSRNLWSKKSSELYSLLAPITSSQPPTFSTLSLLQPDTFLGMTNTFVSPKGSGSIERISSKWSYYNKSFVISKDYLLPGEIESQILYPLMTQLQNIENFKDQQLQLLQSPHKYQHSSVSKVQMTKKYFEEYLASIRPGNVIDQNHIPNFGKAKRDLPPGSHLYQPSVQIEQGKTQSNHSKVMSYNVRGLLKGVTVDGLTHLRPLYTLGDLLLALNDVLDETLFAEAIVQIPENPLYEMKKGKLIRVDEEFTSTPKGVEKLYFRLTHFPNQTDRWQAMRSTLLF
jgi:hypothetical protein